MAIAFLWVLVELVTNVNEEIDPEYHIAAISRFFNDFPWSLQKMR
jgi:hypothetical protein